ncbi:gentisate 1,2-dioxygenase [Dyella flava]|uniref:Gentisate 1,2-dioxygenase n=1 Tax=Dyella flava TaxID=1920170 RepID=A0ABS2K4M0_9GAMM|nr:gentisate 1,2-dioxygenase [Dyella flava]MBM7126005.1 gentisate 1,2-dioxygenase [Dyella flava]GLQ49197.1 gentisate 1,2-dioxygenase [Dyella flava]
MQAHSIEPAQAQARRDYYERIDKQNLTPLWEVLGRLVTSTPTSPAVAALWRYAEIREPLLEAGRLISAAEAERRVLVLENPALRGLSAITQSVYAGLQLIMPGEVAAAHRHTQSALRLLLEGDGAYTAVDGERTTMRRGDFVLTPGWTWHDHGNPGKQPAIWLDGLDIPLVRFFDASFSEHSSVATQMQAKPEGDSLKRYGTNMLPVDYQPARVSPSPVFVYPYERSREALLGISHGEPDPHLGFKLRYVNPATGGSPMPTIGAYVQRLPRGFETRPYRCTDGTVYVCLEGSGYADINGTTHSFGPNDIFVVPSWNTLRIHATADTHLFSFSDRPVHQALGLWREARE